MKYSRFIKRVSDESIRDFSGLGNPILLLLLLLLSVKQQLKTVIAGLFIVIVVSQSAKLLFNKERPKKVLHKNLFELIQARSFPSVHSAEIMYTGLVIIKNINSMLIDILIALIILIVGYSRHYLKKHYVIDILSGYLIGIIVFLILF